MCYIIELEIKQKKSTNKSSLLSIASRGPILKLLIIRALTG